MTVRSSATIAVVVPTFNRAPSLERLLRSLEVDAASSGAPSVEVVVVDDASTDDTQEVLARFASSSSLPVRTIRVERNAGPAAARNRGWAASESPVVCFTDDDCVVQPGWLRAMAEALEDAEIAQGRTSPAPEQAGNRGPFSHTMDIPHEDGHYPTCNIAYRRSILEAVAGFDERFRLPYGEDTDLAWRAIDAGARTTFVEDAVVEHDVRPSELRAHLQDLRRREGLVLAIRKHPRLRGQLPYRGYLRPTHPPVLALAATLLVAAWRPTLPTVAAVLAAGAWYALICHRYRWGPQKRWQWVAVLPVALFADLFEIGVLGRASLRYRRVVL